MKKLVKSSTNVNAATAYTDSFTYTRGRQKFSVHTAYSADPDKFQCQISEIHPYDLTDYAWAKKDQPASAAIVHNRKVVKRIPVPEWDEDSYETADEYCDDVIDTMCVQLKRFNSQFEPRIDHI